MNDSVTEFYDSLSSHYHLIFANWRASVLRQGEILDTLLRKHIHVSSTTSVLDCSCGIGTQAIGLALRGYQVHASDISPKAVERAKKEAQALDASLTLSVADFRYLDQHIAGTYTVVLSCDNALPHLLTDNELLLATKSMKTKLQKDGLLVLSIRDYDQLIKEKPRAELPRVFDTTEGRRITFQVWDWNADGTTYTLNHFIVKQTDTTWEALHHQTHYRALQRNELTALLAEVRLTAIRWHMPDVTGFHQPIVTARNT